MAIHLPKVIVFGVIALSAIVGLALYGPIPQDPAYFGFADKRTIAGIPNCFDTISNFPFLVFGIWGIRLLGDTNSRGYLSSLRPAYFHFFVGSILIAFGSMYFNLDPNHRTLIFDRLPMTISFMAFFSVMVGEYIEPRLGRLLLYPLLVAGMASVLYWAFTEERGRGDLRPYILVQFLPMVLIPLMAVFCRSTLQPGKYVWGVLSMYGVAKVFEGFDQAIFQAFKLASGHTVKHLAAAIGVYFFAVAVAKRYPDPRPISANAEASPAIHEADNGRRDA